MSALANRQVGDYVNRHFVSTYVKVGTFQLVQGQKQGGNVATYFCLADGSVLHAIAGPVDANTFLYETRWIVAVHQRASLEGRDNPARFQQVVRDAHADRLQRDHRLARHTFQRLPEAGGEDDGRFAGEGPLTSAKKRILYHHRDLDPQGHVHVLLTLFTMEKVEAVYTYVFQSILNEKVSSLPVVEK